MCGVRSSECCLVSCVLTMQKRWITFGDDFKVGFAVTLNACFLDARPGRRHLVGVSRLAHCHQIWTLGDVLLGELDGHFVLTFHAGHVDARVRLQAVIVGDHVTLTDITYNESVRPSYPHMPIGNMSLYRLLFF